MAASGHRPQKKKKKKTAKPRGTKISHSFAEKLRHAETWGFNLELNSVHQKKRLSRSRPMQFLLHAGRKEVRKTSNCAGCDRFSCVWWASKSSTGEPPYGPTVNVGHHCQRVRSCRISPSKSFICLSCLVSGGGGYGPLHSTTLGFNRIVQTRWTTDSTVQTQRQNRFGARTKAP